MIYYRLMKVGSFLLIVSAYIYSMEMPSLKELATKKVIDLAAHDFNYCIQALDTLPHELGMPIVHDPIYCAKVINTRPPDMSIALVQYLMRSNKYKSVLPQLLVSYRLYQQQQQQNNTNQHIIDLILDNNQQVQLTSEQSRELIQAAATIRNLMQDIDNGELSQEIPLPLLSQEQVTTLLPYTTIINAINISDNTLPALQQEIPETTTLSSYYLKYTAIQQLKEYLTTQAISTLCNLIITASYFDIQNNEHLTNFAELATHALGDKLLQAPQYQEEYNVISTLPNTIQRMLVSYLIDNNIIRYTLCGNSTDAINNTAQRLIGHTDSAFSISWSPDGKYIASGSNDKTIKTWNTTTNTCIHTLGGHTQGVESVSWAPDGKYIASGSGDREVKIWDARTGTCIRTLEGHIGLITSLSWSPDGKHIASGSGDKTIKVWDAITGTCIHTLRGHTNWTESISWSPDGKQIASCSNDETVRVWDANAGTCIRTLHGHTNWVNSVSWSPDGQYIASGSRDETVKVWNANAGTCVHTLKGHTNWVYAVSWSPDSKYIVSSSGDKTVRVWDTNTGTYIHTLESHTRLIRSVSWSPDGKHIASGSWNETIIKIFDADTGTCIYTLEGHIYGLNSVSWSSNGKFIVGHYPESDKIQVWDVATGTCIHTFRSYTKKTYSIAWSPNSRYIASSCFQTIQVWDAINGTCIHTLKNHITNFQAAVSWSPDGSMIMSSFDNNTIKIWHIIDKKLDDYLQSTLSWQQALLLVRIINAHNNRQDIDFSQDIQARHCYDSLPKDIEQLVKRYWRSVVACPLI